jgi:hypothetical protein
VWPGIGDGHGPADRFGCVIRTVHVSHAMVSGTFPDRYAGRTVLPIGYRDVKPLFPTVMKWTAG